MEFRNIVVNRVLSLQYSILLAEKGNKQVKSLNNLRINIIFIIIIIIIIVSIITVFAGVLFVHQPGANHAPRASVTRVNHSVHTLSTFLRIRADLSMQIF